jgi:hypothetical protein
MWRAFGPKSGYTSKENALKTQYLQTFYVRAEARTLQSKT